MKKSKSITVRLPEADVARLEAAAEEQGTTVSEVLREAVVEYRAFSSHQPDTMALIGDLIGSVKGMPRDLSSRKKHYLREGGYGENRSR